MPNLWIPLVVFSVVYLLLSVVVTATIVRHVRETVPSP